MKKAILVFVIAVMVLITTGLWLFRSPENLKAFDFVTFGIVLLVVLFAVFIGFRRLNSSIEGEPAEDEMSKKVLLRTAAASYYISLYMWVGILFIKDRVSLDSEEMLGAGILGMAISFALCWLFFHFRGSRNE
jgi:peptidoglycan/LPS O-acetylase OafA/YrhL